MRVILRPTTIPSAPTSQNDAGGRDEDRPNSGSDPAAFPHGSRENDERAGCPDDVVPSASRHAPSSSSSFPAGSGDASPHGEYTVSACSSSSLTTAAPPPALCASSSSGGTVAPPPQTHKKQLKKKSLMRPRAGAVPIAPAEMDADAEATATRVLAASLSRRGLELSVQEGDGNCLFRAVSLQVFGDPGAHREVRKRCLDFMENNKEHFGAFITGESFDEYVARKRNDGVHGNNPEIQALSELFNRPVEVFVPDSGDEPINIFQSDYKTTDIPIRLSYHDGNHYNAVIDPLVPTAGLGLGLPGLKPGEADRSQMREAVRMSDEAQDEAALQEVVEQSRWDGRSIGGSGSAFEKEMTDEKIRVLAMSDMEATEIELEKAIMSSSLEAYHRGQMVRRPEPAAKRRRNNNFDFYPRNVAAPRPVKGSPSGHETPTWSAPKEKAGPSPADDHALPDRDEYPGCVQELVMNGFELSRVLRAYDLVGDNFDDLLALMMGQGV